MVGKSIADLNVNTGQLCMFLCSLGSHFHSKCFNMIKELEFEQVPGTCAPVFLYPKLRVIPGVESLLVSNKGPIVV